MKKLTTLFAALLYSTAAFSQAGGVYTGPNQPGQVIGTGTNDNALVGNVGQETISNIAQGSAISLTTGTVANLTSVSLTPGDWDVQCTAQFLPAATTSVTSLLASTSLTTAALDISVANGFKWTPSAAFVPGGGHMTQDTPVRRFSLSVATTVFCPVEAFFTVSTMTVWGTLRARRVR